MAADEGVRSEAPAENEPEDVPELESIGSQMAYESFLSAAKAIEPSLIEECCADVVLTYHTVMRGVESVVGSGAVLVGKLPNVNVEELSMLPRLAQGLAFAALQVQRELQSASFGMLFERAQQLRRKLRKAAEALAEASLLAEADIDEVRVYAPRELIEDCLALAALLRRNEARIAGRSPVTAPDIRETEQVAEKLRSLLGQGDTGEAGTPSLVKVIEMRDRFWTLLNQRHDMLWRCGAWLFGRAVDERVPPLPVRQSLVRKTQPQPRAVAPVEREAPRRVTEPRRTVGPPVSIVPVRPPPVRDSARHLADLQRDLERKTRFLVRIGVIPQR